LGVGKTVEELSFVGLKGLGVGGDFLLELSQLVLK